MSAARTHDLCRSTVPCVGGTWRTSINLCFCTKHLVQHLAQYLSALIMLKDWMSLPYLDFPITSYSTLFSTKWLQLTVVELTLFCRSEWQGFSSLLMRCNVPTLLAEAEGVGLHSQSLGICKFRIKLRNGSFPSSQEMLGIVLWEVVLCSTSSLLQRGTHDTHLLPFLC